MKKIISIILVFAFFNITFSGCMSSKLLSIEEVSQKQHSNEFLILHVQKRIFLLKNFEFTDTKLKGELTKYSKKRGYNVHVYTPVDIHIKAVENSSQYFEMEKSDISKISYLKFNYAGTTVLFVAGTIGLIYLVALVSLSSGSGGYYGGL